MLIADKITKTYRRQRVVSDVSFTCRPGRITGFLGPNGAGKSTTMRIFAGLTSPDSGSATVDGRLYRELPNPGRVLGTLIDARALASGRTGIENLRLVAMSLGLGRVDVVETLERVGLDERAGRKRVAEYSLGMRQRLGIAQALLGNPQYLMLDEPSNGLDPAGILWMRRLLREYADQGGTVLLSSHLLHEVEILADDLVLLSQGRVIAQGTTHELTTTGETLVSTPAIDVLAHVLRTAGVTISERRDDLSLVVADEPARVGHLAADHGIRLTHLGHHDVGALEDLFLGLTTTAGTAGSADTVKELVA